jgi:hypothetical protein
MECTTANNDHEPTEEKIKRTKHTRVQKREKELYGLVTPVFLPLLDARDTGPKIEKKSPKQHNRAEASIPEHTTAPTGDADKTKKPRRDMEPTDTAHVEAPKKSKRISPTKKSALRTHTSSKPRRKRVSLVIDGQTVLPADTVLEPALTSPSSEATSASNSTASLNDEMIDPRLTRVHTEAVHHSLPLPMSNNLNSPTKPLIDTAPASFVENEAIILDSPSPPTKSEFIPPAATDADTDPQFNTYVGGLRGSGADDVDQAGSYGYPSSLGASYLESYMQSRPLRVRMEAADKAELNEKEKKTMIKGRDDESESKGRSRTGGEDVEMVIGESGDRGRRGGDEDGDDFMGEMEGF